MGMEILIYYSLHMIGMLNLEQKGMVQTLTNTLLLEMVMELSNILRKFYITIQSQLIRLTLSFSVIKSNTVSWKFVYTKFLLVAQQEGSPPLIHFYR